MRTPHTAMTPITPTALHASLSRRVASLAVLDVRFTPQLRLAEVLGPCTRLPDGVREGLGGHCNLLSPNAHLLASAEPGQAVGFVAGLSADIPPASRVCVQVCASWREGGHGVERVVTVALDTTDDVSTYVAGVRLGVAGAVVAKRVLSAAVNGEAAFDRRQGEELCRRMGVHVRFLAERFGGVAGDQRGRAWLSGRRLTLPPALFDLAQVVDNLAHH